MATTRRGRRSQKDDRFTVSKYIDNRGGEEREVWRVTGYDLDGSRIRKSFGTYGEAAAERDRLNVSRDNQQLSLTLKQTSLTEPQLREAERAVAILGRHGILKAAEFFTTYYREGKKEIAVKDAYQKFLTELAGAGRRDRTLENLRVRVGHLVADYGDRSVHEILVDNISDVIEKPRGRHRVRSLRSRRNERLALSRFFKWCMGKGYCQTNPVAGTLNPDPSDQEREPHILSAAEAAGLTRFAAVHDGGSMLAYIVLALFAAVRPDELGRISWRDIDLSNRTLHISKQASKTKGHAREVELPKNAVEWLRLIADKEPPIRPTGYRRLFLECVAHIGYGKQGKSWVPDTLRHTAASFYCALTGDEGKTASWARHGVAVLRRHYKRIIGCPKELKAFWNVRPSGHKGKVVPMPVSAKKTA